MRQKERVFDIIERGQGGHAKANRLFEGLIIGMILLSMTQIILESFESIARRHASLFYIIELITVAVFTVEYLLRLWTARLAYPHAGPLGARLRFIFSTLGLVDLLAILPFYLPFLIAFDLRFLRILRTLRLLRVFKLGRYMQSMRLVGDIFREKRVELFVTLTIAFLLLIMASTIMFYLETEVQPDEFPNIVATFWWAVATLTTVGYGDVFPVTGWGKVVSGIIAVLGIGIVALPTGILSAAFVEKLEATKKAKPEEENRYRFCPHCGKPL
jgi:voltage-gated potassium channel